MNIPSDKVQKHRISANDYFRMVDVGLLTQDARVELIEGEIYDMAPTGPVHSSLVAYMAGRLILALAGDATVCVQSTVKLVDFSAPEPDLAVLTTRGDYYRSALPVANDMLIAIEIADSSFQHNKIRKAAVNARYGIPVYWLIDVVSEQFLVFDSPQDSEYSNCQNLAYQSFFCIRVGAPVPMSVPM